MEKFTKIKQDLDPHQNEADPKTLMFVCLTTYFPLFFVEVVPAIRYCTRSANPKIAKHPRWQPWRRLIELGLNPVVTSI